MKLLYEGTAPIKGDKMGKKREIAEGGMLNDSSEMLDQVSRGKWQGECVRSSFEFVELS